jgi:Protein of unknown function (DUF3040)
VEVAGMDGPGLSSRERQILAQIEAALGRDKRLARRLRAFRPTFWVRCRQAAHRVRGWGLGLLTVVSVCLLAAAVRTSSTALVVAFAVTWAVTLLLSLLTWRNRRRRRR